MGLLVNWFNKKVSERADKLVGQRTRDLSLQIKELQNEIRMYKITDGPISKNVGDPKRSDESPTDEGPKDQVDKTVVGPGPVPNGKVSPKNIDELRDLEAQDKLKRLLKGNKVRMVNQQDSGLGQDIQVVAKEFTADRNVFRFGNSGHIDIGVDTLLGVIQNKSMLYNQVDDEGNLVKPRYVFLGHFRFIHAISRSAIKSAQANRFRDICGSLLSFSSAKEYRKAGFPQETEEMGLRDQIADKLKKEK